MIEFAYPERQGIRMIELEGTPMFVGEDVAKLLGFSEVSRALDECVSAKDRVYVEGWSVCEGEPVTLVTEAGLMALAERAQEDKHLHGDIVSQWLSQSVLPDIRLVYSAWDKCVR